MPPRAQKSTRTHASEASPDRLRERLIALAKNLSWTWIEVAQRPFAMLDPMAWEATNHAPLATLRTAGPERLAASAEDPRFLAVLKSAEAALKDAGRAKRWFPTSHRGRDARLRVAYFCSEFAIHESMQQYSGGLGVLAGDHLKSAENLGVPSGRSRAPLPARLLPTTIRSRWPDPSPLSPIQLRRTIRWRTRGW